MCLMCLFMHPLYTYVTLLWLMLHWFPTNTMCVASGEDMAYEHVYNYPAGVHRGSVGSEVHCGLLGVPLHPHYDGAATPPHSLQDF